MSNVEKVKVLIIGSGPAGYTAANDVENFPGYPDGINGPQMMIDLQKQAERFGTKINYGLVTSVDFSSYPLIVTVDETKVVEAESVIVATGASAKYLGIPSEQ